MKKQAVLSLSGGMDSSTVLLRLLADGYEVTALSFDYGQKHRVELERAQALVNILIMDDYDVEYGVIKLDGLAPMLNSALVEGGDEVPEGHYQQENMKETVVPNRNKIFSSIIQAVALSQAQMKKIQKYILQWAFMQVITQSILIVDKNSEMLIIMPSPRVIGTLIALAILPLILMGINLIYLKMESDAVINLGLTLIQYIQIQILATSPLILMVSGTVIINQHLQLKGLKHLLNWADPIRYPMQMKEELLIGKLYELMLNKF
jgi:hypothetical protein